MVVKRSGISVRLSPKEITFIKGGKKAAPAFHIPNQFADVAVEFLDLYFEDEMPTVILACRKGYDIAIHIDETTGAMKDWHYTK